jgi:hypothetical protein
VAAAATAAPLEAATVVPPEAAMEADMVAPKAVSMEEFPEPDRAMVGEDGEGVGVATSWAEGKRLRSRWEESHARVAPCAAWTRGANSGLVPWTQAPARTGTTAAVPPTAAGTRKECKCPGMYLNL